MQQSRTYYKVLEVDSEASVEVIEAAYRRLARMYHPDLNKGQDATRRMQEINDAYAVLRDPQRRAEYDSQLEANTRQETDNPRSESTRQQPEPESSRPTSSRDDLGAAFAAAGMPVMCEQCGRSDSTLRLAAFPYVVSVIILSFRRGSSGLFCEECRRKKMRGAKLISLLFGWWGIPFGLFWTLGVLFAPNDGQKDAKLNADYLRWLGAYFVRTGRIGEARRAFRSSLNLHYDAELAGMVHAAFGEDELDSSKKQAQPGWKAGCAVVGALLTIIFAANLFDGGSDPLPTSTSSRPTATSPRPTPTSMQARTTSPAVVKEKTSKEPSSLSGWTRTSLANGTVVLDLPSGWEVTADEDQSIQLWGDRFGLWLMWIENETGTDVEWLIESSKGDPALAAEDRRQMYDWLVDSIADESGTVLNLVGPKYRTFGQYSSMYFDSLLNYTEGNTARNIHLLLFRFDCGDYVCEVHAYKPSTDSFSTNDWAILQPLIEGIQLSP